MEEPIHHALREHLIRVARTGQPTHYGVIAPTAGIDLANDFGWARIGVLLGHISEYEWMNNRPLLSAVVIGREGNLPGGGFFTLAKQLGRYNGSTALDRIDYWMREFNDVRAYWRAHTE